MGEGEAQGEARPAIWVYSPGEGSEGLDGDKKGVDRGLEEARYGVDKAHLPRPAVCVGRGISSTLTTSSLFIYIRERGHIGAAYVRARLGQ